MHHRGPGRLITLRALSTSTASPTDSSQLPSGRWEQDTSHTFKIERRAQQPIPTPAEMCPPCRAQQRSQHAAGSGNSQPKKSQTAAVLVQSPKLCNWQVPAPAPGTLVSHAPKYAVGRPRVMHQHDSGHAQTEYKEAGDNSLWQTACSMQLLPEDSQ